MIVYYKHTGGNVFTLNKESYTGLFNVIDGQAWSGSSYTSSSQLLSSTNTFLSTAYLNKLSFNKAGYAQRVFDSLQDPSIDGVRSIFDFTTLSKVLQKIHENNILIYSSGFYYDSNFFNREFKITEDLPATYSLSANKAVPSVTFNTVDGISLPLSNLGERRILKSVSLKESTLLVGLDSKFKYQNGGFCLNGYVNALSSLSITSGHKIDKNNENSFIVRAHYDKVNSKLYQLNGIKQIYNIYEYEFENENNDLVKKDTIKLTSNRKVVTNETCTFGKRYRTAVTRSPENKEFLEIYSIDNNELIREIDIQEEYGVTGIVSSCQRFEDDAIALITYTYPESRIDNLRRKYEYRMIFADVADLIATKKVISNNKLRIRGYLPKLIEFADFDSNIVITRHFYQNTLVDVMFYDVNFGNWPLAGFNRITAAPYIRSIYRIEEIQDNIDASGIILNNITADVMRDIQFHTTTNVNSIYTSFTRIQTSNKSLLRSTPPIDLRTVYTPLVDTKSSIGLTINNALRSALIDTLSIYSSFSRKPGVTSTGTRIVFDPIELKGIYFPDLKLNENESINALSVNRVIEGIYGIQKELVSKI